MTTAWIITLSLWAGFFIGFITAALLQANGKKGE